MSRIYPNELDLAKLSRSSKTLIQIRITVANIVLDVLEYLSMYWSSLLLTSLELEPRQS